MSSLVVVLHACQIKSFLFFVFSMQMCACVLYRNRERERERERPKVGEWCSEKWVFFPSSVALFLRVLGFRVYLKP
jgi:hypothetical protein